MGRTLRTAITITGLTLGLGLATGGVSQAGQEAAPDPSSDTAIDPNGESSDVDIEAAAAEFEALAAAAAGLAPTSPSGGSSLTGPCGGFAHSYGENGDLIDSAIDLGDGSPPIDLLDGGQAFTSGNPFKVDTRGIVTYFGFMPMTGEGPMNHSWYIDTVGISLDTGGHPNPAGDNRNAGIVNLDDDLPVKFSAKVKISGQLTSENLAPCAGDGYVEFIGDGLLSPIGIGGIAIAILGLAGILFNARPAMTYKG